MMSTNSVSQFIGIGTDAVDLLVTVRAINVGPTQLRNSNLEVGHRFGLVSQEYEGLVVVHPRSGSIALQTRRF